MPGVSFSVGVNALALRLALAASVLTAACAIEPGPLLTGQWGGRLVSLDVQESEAQLQFPCMSAKLPRPTLDASGHFEEIASITWVSWAGYSPAGLRVTGDVNGFDMSLTIAYVSPPSFAQPQHYTLRRGAPPDFSDVACLA